MSFNSFNFPIQVIVLLSFFASLTRIFGFLVIQIPVSLLTHRQLPESDYIVDSCCILVGSVLWCVSDVVFHSLIPHG